MIYHKYSISCEDTEGKLIGFVVYTQRLDTVTVVEYIEATMGYTLKGLKVEEEKHEKRPIETSSTVILHEY